MRWVEAEESSQPKRYGKALPRGDSTKKHLPADIEPRRKYETM
jgi:hypothetical protein